MYQQPPSASPSCHVSMGPTSDSDREHDQRPERFNGGRLGQVADYKSNGCDDLIRQRSSPAGFFINQLNATSINSTLAAADDDNNNNINNGFSGPREGSGSGNSKGEIGRQNSQLSFMRRHDSILSHISEEESENGVDEHIKKTANSYGNSSSYELCSWPDDPSNSIVFSSSPSRKRAININGDAINCPNRKESQLQFGLHRSALEMCAMENLMHIPEDSVPCKIRAKRGCATHPRSIAERERRTRISRKLKKLQDLVPNMDKQTSYADMLDLAVQHIKGLQNQVQELNSELEDCKCGCNRTT